MMNEEHESYRPRSPDLSTFPPQPPPPLSTYNVAVYQQNYSMSHRGSYDASPYFSPQTATIPQSYFNNLPNAPTETRLSLGSLTASEGDTPQQQPVFSQPFYTAPGVDYSSAFNPQFQSHLLHSTDTKMARRRKSEEVDEDYAPDTQSTRMTKRARKNEVSESSIPVQPPGPGPSQGIEVKTKFPVARIKRIMQADEDVGKLAMAAPIAVSKALELFMISLVTKAADEARGKSSKRVSAMHLKQAVEKDQNFDFLIDTISKVSEQAEGKKGSKARSESPDPPEDGKRKKGGGRKKKVESED